MTRTRRIAVALAAVCAVAAVTAGTAASASGWKPSPSNASSRCIPGLVTWGNCANGKRLRARYLRAPKRWVTTGGYRHTEASWWLDHERGFQLFCGGDDADGACDVYVGHGDFKFVRHV